MPADEPSRSWTTASTPRRPAASAATVPELVHRGLAGGGVHGHVGVDAAEDDRVDAARAQEHRQVGAVEAAEPRGLPTIMSSGRTSTSECNAASGAPSLMTPPATGESATKTLCMSTITSAVRPGSTANGTTCFSFRGLCCGPAGLGPGCGAARRW